MGGWVDGWMGGWVDGWMDGWVDGWTRWRICSIASRAATQKQPKVILRSMHVSNIKIPSLYRLTS